MNLRLFLKFTALVAAAFGLILIIGPAWVLALFGGSSDITGLLFVQFLGAPLLGIAALNWQAARSGDKQLLEVVIKANLASLSTASILNFWGQLNGALNGWGWPLFAWHLCLLIGFMLSWRNLHTSR